MTEEQKEFVIRIILRISPWYEEKDITESTSLFKDLDFDSLDFSELLLEVESEFKIQIHTNEWFNQEVTIGKVFKLITDNLK